jgi:hypothetical protein
VRIAERAGLAGASTLEVAAGTPTAEAWSAVCSGLGVSEARLAEVMASFFRMDVADFSTSDPDAFNVVPEALSRKHLIFPLRETDRQVVVATCDPTNVEVERILGFSSGRQAVFEVASPRAIKAALEDRSSPDKDGGEPPGDLRDGVRRRGHG